MAISDIDLESKIVSTFHLFEGLREQKEDEMILERVYEECVGETVRFLYENLNENDAKYLTEKLEILADSTDNQLKILTDVLFVSAEKIPDYKFLLEQRLNSFIDKLLVSSIKKGENNVRGARTDNQSN